MTPNLTCNKATLYYGNMYTPSMGLGEVSALLKYTTILSCSFVDWENSSAWYIPPHWLASHSPQPETILDAAMTASHLANTDIDRRTMSNSAIPLIVHQTWKHRHVDTWSKLLRDSVEKWLEFVVSDNMAYFLWDDEGIMLHLAEFEPSFIDRFMLLPVDVERTDVFRILVLKWFGGIVRSTIHLTPFCYLFA